MIIFDKNKPFFKADLHVHTTLSDGDLTPEQVKEHCKKLGFSVVAFTDHEIMKTHNDLTDKNFVALNGVEIATNKENGKAYCKSAHFNFIATSPLISVQPTYNPEYDWLHSEQEKSKVKSFLPDYERKHTIEDFNKVINVANKNGFLSIYNHPSWSLHNYNDYMGMKGLFAVEIINGDSFINGYRKYDDSVYQDFLLNGDRLFAVAGTDAHTKKDLNDGFCAWNSCYTMIQTSSLSYENIVSALKNGKFYCTTGPEIYNMELKDGVLSIECSPVMSIQVDGEFSTRTANILRTNNLKEKITFAKFDLKKEESFIRVTLTDEFGNKAFTNALFEV